MSDKLNIPEDVMNQANAIMREQLSADEPWPDDTWIEIGSDWDLNLWDSEGEKKAAIHRVVNGTTTDMFQLVEVPND